MDHITHNFWLGSQRDADELIRDNAENITAILNVRGPDQYDPPGRDQSAEHPGKAYKWIPAPDIEIIYPQHVKEAVAWLREQTGQGQRVLIHCMHGISRSPAFLAAFLVESGIAAHLEEARATISAQRRVHPARQLLESAKPVVLVSALTGLPNRQAFDQTDPSPSVAAIAVPLKKIFADSYGPMAMDTMIRRLAKILVNAGLETYHQQADEFLCKGESTQEMREKLSRAQRIFAEPFEIYADGRMQMIEDMGFAFEIGTRAEETVARLRHANAASVNYETPEWLRKILGTGGPGRTW